MALQKCFKGLKVVVGEVIKALDYGLKTLVVFGLTGGCDRRQGPTMEARHRRQNHRLFDAASGVAMFAGQLDGSFVGFCS